ncbi:coleoptile phototropism protein 1 [Salvia hispanica]|uniref:coleoptile phototropism protein 1 n=1 Tax=Salvia hispanica TaxID=49212 RepID=UPI0020090E18|nr:coleoptile phototropism protein 1 [Salvia hispanica]
MLFPNKMQSSPSLSPSSGKQAAFSDECWSEDASASDTENFVKTLNQIRGKGVRPDLIASIITHYASKCLPALADDDDTQPVAAASRRKKRRFIETLVGILPQEKDAVPCGFLLRAMRVAGEAGAEAGCREEIERRAARQLDQAPLKELAALGIEAVVRLVRRFLSEEEVSRSGAALCKVARLVHSYLAEAASDRNLTLPQFVALATAVPCHARATDDGIYRAIDIYIKAHPGLSKQERKNLCMLMESRKLSTEACLHAAQNERLPVRAVIRVLLSEQDKLSKHMDWSGSLRSPGVGLAAPARCLSKREVRQQIEIRRLKEDVAILQGQCLIMERQIEKLLEKKKGYFSWKRLGGTVFKASKIGETVAGASSPFYSGGSRT